MKKLIWALLLCVLLLPAAAHTESTAAEQTAVAEITASLQGLSMDELLAVEKAIQSILTDRGYVLYNELDRGAKGDDVIKVQERLKELGYYNGSLSGKFDSETQKAFKLFEKNNGLNNDGKASQADLTVLFGSSPVGKATPAPAVTEPVIEKQSAQDAPEGYLPFSDFDYTEYFRYPEKYYGTKIVLRGKVMQVIGSRGSGYQIRLATAASSDIVYVRIPQDPGFNILEDDRVTVYAVMKNPYTYITTFLNSVTIPSADADRIILN